MELSYDHLHIRCQDVEAAEKFYKEILGAKELARKSVPGMSILKLELGGVTISLSPAKDGLEVEDNSGRPRWGAYQIGYLVPDIHQACAELEAKGVKISSGPTQARPDLWVAFFDALDGVEIELMQHA